MILLGIPPFPGLDNLSLDLSLGPPLRLHPSRDVARDFGLLGGVVEDAASILGAGVGALAVLGGGVVHAVEEFEKGGVGELSGVECYLEGFGVWILLDKT